MKARKRAKKASKEISFVHALDCIEDDTFKNLVNPSANVMRRVVEKYPKAILYMPQADTELRRAAIQQDISLLMHDYPWGFDTEELFPGSTVWREEYEDYYFTLYNTGYERIGILSERMNRSWGSLKELATWPASRIFLFERYLLSNSSHNANLRLAEELVTNFPGGNRSIFADSEDVSDSLHACLESTTTD
jgi:hypothetical protein